jgi:hypothetical protein
MNDNNLKNQYTIVNFRFKGTKKNIRWRTLSKYVSSLKSRLNKIGACTEWKRLDNGMYHGIEKQKAL